MAAKTVVDTFFLSKTKQGNQVSNHANDLCFKYTHTNIHTHTHTHTYIHWAIFFPGAVTELLSPLQPSSTYQTSSVIIRGFVDYSQVVLVLETQRGPFFRAWRMSLGEKRVYFIVFWAPIFSALDTVRSDALASLLGGLYSSVTDPRSLHYSLKQHAGLYFTNQVFKNLTIRVPLPHALESY